ncbi:MAG TPA: nitroreductase [Candidatus Sulfotelmatobacter sp.]|nr:nitroreductase [Candidatus Sulfotelmatobacter sp.]
MDLQAAVTGRRSIRRFRPDPVPATVLRELLDAARWTPSAANTQPWEFTIVTGKPLRELRQRLQVEATADPVGKPEMGWPPNLPERFKARRLEIGNATMQALGIAADDQARKQEWVLAGLRFFDAPHVILLTMERCFGDLALLDMGAVALALQLLAHAKGLGTCPQAAPLRYPWVYHQVLGISEHMRVVLALPVGYPVADAPVNRFERSRVGLKELLHWQGETA